MIEAMDDVLNLLHGLHDRIDQLERKVDKVYGKVEYLDAED
jgi:hypothetical protein